MFKKNKEGFEDSYDKLLFDEEEVEFEIPNRKSLKMVKYVGATTLTLALISGMGISVYDTTIDHTEELCPIAQIFSYSFKEKLPIGYKHQIDKMENEYKNNEINASITYKDLAIETSYIESIDILEPTQNTVYNYETNTLDIYYTVPDGYTLKVIDGKIVAYRENVITKSLNLK